MATPRLTPPSRTSTIVEAIRELQRQMRDVHDVIRADGSEIDRLEKRQDGIYQHIQILRGHIKTLSNSNKTRVANATFKKGMLLNSDVTSKILGYNSASATQSKRRKGSKSRRKSRRKYRKSTRRK